MGNALLGSKNPTEGKFSTGKSGLQSVTKIVNGFSGPFFGKKEDRDFPDDIDHFELNVIDSPGWGDSDPAMRETNAQKIAQSLKFGVHLFVLVQSGELVRFSNTEQKILGDLHEWTNGAVWNRLLILERASFSEEKILTRSSQKDKGLWFESKNTDDIKKIILNFGWTILEEDIRRNLTMDDLEGLRRLPFDASQTDKCDRTYLKCDHQNPTDCKSRKNFKFRLCHKMPIWEKDANETGLDTTFDVKQNDKDYYHEYEDYPIIFWDYVEDPPRNQKNISRC